MSSVRNHMSDAQLVADAAYNRDRETRLKMRARTEWDASRTLQKAHACAQRAAASEAILWRRRLDADQVARFK